MGCPVTVEEAEKIVLEARKNPIVDGLYVQVDNITPITIQPSADDNWSSSTQGDATTIEALPCRHPQAALYHELLHADLKIEGFKQYLTVAKRRHATPNMTFLQALDNELQHHRIFGRFLGAGFPADQFYDDKDATALDHIRTRVERAKKKPPTSAGWLILALTPLAPGGAGKSNKRSATLALLKRHGGAEVARKVETMEQILQSWGSSTSNDCSAALQQILALTEETGYWVGRSQVFPAEGFFVGPPFELADI